MDALMRPLSIQYGDQPVSTENMDRPLKPMHAARQGRDTDFLEELNRLCNCRTHSKCDVRLGTNFRASNDG